MAIKYDSEVNDKVVSILNESIEGLNSNFRNNLSNDFSPLTQVGLIASQINNLKTALDTLVSSCESLNSSIQNNKYQWAIVEKDIGSDINGLEDVTTSGGKTFNTTGNSPYSGSTYYESSNGGSSSMTSIAPTVSVSTDEVKSFLTKIDNTTAIALLKRINKYRGDNDLLLLFTDPNYSGVLLSILKLILGDTSGTLTGTVDDIAKEIQKELLSKLNTEKYDLDTAEGLIEFEKAILKKLNDSTVDESALDTLLYGDHTVKIETLGGRWVVAKTVQDLSSYASYVQSAGVKQNANTAEWGDSCLAFAGAHAYDLYAGTCTSGPSAANYAHGSSFEDFIDDDKSKVLAKIYEEIMKGRPLVLQVNGNKAGTSRHFVTVVGFREGITSADQLTEKDLLIIDSWDGKVERMDTETSRFMTSGRDCHKDYSGYRLRVFKESMANA